MFSSSQAFSSWYMGAFQTPRLLERSRIGSVP
jgi:hypothetical protein